MKNVISSMLVISMVTVSCSDFTNQQRIVNGANSQDQQGANDNSKTSGDLPAELQNPNLGNFSEAKMLVNIGLNVQYKSAVTLNAQARLLQNRVNRFCETLEKNESSETTTLNSATLAALGRAQDQFKETMLSYHFAEAVSAGPLSNRGKFLSDNIYSWPYIDYCGVDREVVKRSQGEAPNSRLIHTVKGLGALEYLLFEETLNPRCNLRANQEVRAWTQRTNLEKRKDRCAQAQVAVSELVAKTTQLESEWNPQQGNFVKKAIDGSAYPTLKAATNALVDSMFIGIEKLKDARLGKPLGRHKECLADDKKCPEMAEHALSGIALEAIAAQMAGFKAAWTGDHDGVNGFGLSDFIRQSGGAAAAQQMDSLIGDVEKNSELLIDGESLQTKISVMDANSCLATSKDNRAVPVCGLHADVREVANTLKIEVFTLLSLQVPSFGQGDND